MKRSRIRCLCNERGQALVETGIVMILLVTLTMGIVEFGRAFMILNMITQAARAGARAASVAPLANRSTTGTIDSTYEANIESLVDSEIRAVLGPDTNLLTIAMTQGNSGGVPTVSVNVAGNLPLIFNLIPVADQLAVDRTVTFRDEGR